MKLCCSIIMAATFLILSSCGSDNLAQKEVLRPVRYQQVFTTGGVRERSFSGVAKAALESNLSFKVDGTIEEVRVKIGDTIVAGSLIARIAPQDYELQVQETEASLASARAEERNAKAHYERVRGLYENKNASKTDLDQARAAAESSEAKVRSYEKRLEMAKLQLSYTRLIAPVSGAIANVMVELNENVSAGKNVAVLTSGSIPEVEVGVPEILISQIREGDPVKIFCDALPDKALGGRVIEVGVASTGIVTTFPVTVALNRPDPEVRPGMAAEVSFQFKSTDTREIFLVPPAAVGEDRTGRFVFVVNQSEEPNIGTAERRPVVTGELTSDGLEVLQGLLDGDMLVTAGVSKIVDGQKVLIKTDGASS